jgi:hypothetical protein
MGKLSSWRAQGVHKSVDLGQILFSRPSLFLVFVKTSKKLTENMRVKEYLNQKKNFGFINDSEFWDRHCDFSDNDRMKNLSRIGKNKFSISH